jgi:hypothetical protein
MKSDKIPGQLDEGDDAAVTDVANGDDQVIVRFIERFSAVFTEAGMARMPARVFVTLLVS